MKIATKVLCGAVLLFGMGCSAAKELGSFGTADPNESIAVQRALAAEVSIERVEENDKYDFYIFLLDESGEPTKTYIVKGLREQARAYYHAQLNSVIIDDEGKALYGLVVDRGIEYRRPLAELE